MPITGEVEQVQLQRFKVAAQSYITKELLRSFAEPATVKVTDQLDWMFGEVALEVVQTVWGREAQRQECKWPWDWWQAFKERWFPDWAKKRWPVKYHHVTIVARELYPQVRLPPDKWEAVISVSKSGW